MMSTATGPLSPTNTAAGRAPAAPGPPRSVSQVTHVVPERGDVVVEVGAGADGDRPVLLRLVDPPEDRVGEPERAVEACQPRPAAGAVALVTLERLQRRVGERGALAVDQPGAG